MDATIISEKNLLSIVKDNNITCIKTSEFAFKNYTQIEVKTFEEFVEYTKILNENVLFYQYRYYDIEDFLIPDDYYEDSVSEIKNRVSDYNDRIRKVDFTKPISLVAFVLKDGTYVGIKFEDTRIDDLEIKDPLTAVEEIEDNYYHGQGIDDDTKLEQLKDYILENADDVDMKNQESRWQFLRNMILNNPKFANSDRLFKPYFGTPRSGQSKVFLDRVKAEYDQIKKENI